MIKFKNIKKSLFLLIFALHLLPIFGQALYINEVMFDPVGADQYDEFIEIYNCSSSPIALENFQIIINGTPDSLICPGPNNIINAHSYALILDRNYLIDQQSILYDEIIPTGTLKATINENSFGLLNSTPNSIYLVSGEGDTITSVITTADQEPGYSDEKIISCNDFTGNWGNSKELLGTPGMKNSIAPKEYDLAISEFNLVNGWQLPPGEPAEFFVKIKNIGLNLCFDANLLCGVDLNRDSILQECEISFTSQAITLEPEDSLEWIFTSENVYPGYSLAMAVINYADDDSTNNKNIREISMEIPQNSLIVNEIMYDPNSNQGGEWVELQNISPLPINLYNWKIADKSNSVFITNDSHIINADSFLVLFKENNFLDFWNVDSQSLIRVIDLPTFNNTSDSVVVWDCFNERADDFEYQEWWGHSKGISLERKNPFFKSINPENWDLSTSQDGGTPGVENSILMKEFDLAIFADSISYYPQKILPGDSLILYIQINNIGQKNATNFSLDVRFHHGVSMAKFGQLIIHKNYTDTLTSFETLYDTLVTKVDFAGAGYLHFDVDYVDDDMNPANNSAIIPISIGYLQNSIAINEIMYLPATDKPEWIEIYNPGIEIVNLKNFYIKDGGDKINKITDQTVQLPPDSFAVIVADEIFNLYEPEFNGILLVAESFPVLNNSGDSLIILDAAEHRLDKLYYSPDWGDIDGTSLERINPYSDDQTGNNWNVSVADQGSTPGIRNSIMIKDFDLTIDSIYFSDNYLLEGDSVSIFVNIKNNGLEPVDNYDVLIKIFEQGNPDDIFFITTIHGVSSLQPREIHTEEIYVNTINGGVFDVFGRVFNMLDENNENDNKTIEVVIGYPDNPLVINEIMFSPQSGECEWFEIFNISNKNVDLNRWQIRDGGGSWAQIEETGNLLGPKQFTIVAANQDFAMQYPDFNDKIIVPENFPVLNNGSDSLLLQDGLGNSRDAIYYKQAWGGEQGISIERRNPFAPAIDSVNWGSSTSKIGATPGLNNSILKYNFDLAVMEKSFQFIPNIIKTGQKTRFEFIVKNKGISNSSQFSSKIYQDQNNDSLAQPGELTWSLHNIPSLEADSTILLEGEVFAGNSGTNNYILHLEIEQEENPDDNKSYTSLLVPFEKNSIVINEFLSNPNNQQVEFVEFFNKSINPINLNNWTVSNTYRTFNIKDQIIQPFEFLIIARDSLFFDYFPPTNAMQIVNRDLLILNNSADKIKIADLTGMVIDSLEYDEDWKISKGNSLEKYLPEYESNISTSWQNSINNFGATPGKVNSITPFNYDVAVDSISLTTDMGDEDALFSVEIKIKNAGLYECEIGVLKIFDCINQEKYLVDSVEVFGLANNSEKSITRRIGPFENGGHTFAAIFNWDHDLNQENDTAYFSISVSYGTNSIFISEFMPNPYDINTVDNCVSEYLEFYNSTHDSINLQGWSISDENTASSVVIKQKAIVPPKGYYVLAADSSIFIFEETNPQNTCVDSDFPSLNNTGDDLFLYDLTGKLLDSLSFESSWKIMMGIALEKIYLKNPNTPNNWRPSVHRNGGTPGCQNSIAVTKQITKAGIKIHPSPFTPNGDGLDEEVGIYFQLPFPSAKVTIEIYDMTSRKIYTPGQNVVSAETGVIHWNGDSDFGGKARVGMYIARCTATDIATNKTVGYIETLVLAR